MLNQNNVQIPQKQEMKSKELNRKLRNIELNKKLEETLIKLQQKINNKDISYSDIEKLLNQEKKLTRKNEDEKRNLQENILKLQNELEHLKNKPEQKDTYKIIVEILCFIMLSSIGLVFFFIKKGLIILQIRN